MSHQALVSGSHLHHHPRMPRLGYRPELDGLRGLAGLLVVLAHTEIGPFRAGGYVGVEMFFVLSGFLITTLLLQEGDANGRISLLAFYGRRLRRLGPALAGLLGALVVAAVWAQSTAELPGIAAALTYTSNVWSAQGHDLGATNHLWSLAVEEHFYLLWPLLLVLVGGKDSRVAALAGAGIVLSLVARFSLDDPVHLYYGTDTRVAALVIGAMAAVLRRRGFAPPTFHLGLILLISQAFTGSAAETDLHRTGFLIVDLAMVCVLLGASPSAPGLRLGLASRPMVWLGSISYALYLWHAPLQHLTDHGVATLIGSVAVAWASTAWIESRYRAPRRAQEAAGTDDRIMDLPRVERPEGRRRARVHRLDS